MTDARPSRCRGAAHARPQGRPLVPGWVEEEQLALGHIPLNEPCSIRMSAERESGGNHRERARERERERERGTDADRGDVRLGVGVVGEPKEETRLSDTGVTDEEELEEVVVFGGGHGRVAGELREEERGLASATGAAGGGGGGGGERDREGRVGGGRVERAEEVGRHRRLRRKLRG